MGYYLLSIENLAVTLLFVATAVALVARIKYRWLRLILAVLIVAVPLVAYGVLTALDIDLEYGSNRTPLGWTVPLVLLTLAFLIGAVMIARRGLRRSSASDLGEGTMADEPIARRWPLGRLTLVFLAALLLHTVTYSNLDAAAKQSLAAVRSEAYTLAMAVAPQPVPDHENAATWYAQVADGLKVKGLGPRGGETEPPSLWGQAVEAMYGKRPEFDFKSPELGAFLAERAGEIAVARIAASKPQCYFRHDYGTAGWDTLIPEVSDLRGTGWLLAASARHAAATGDKQTALADLTAVHAMARHAASEGFPIALLISAALDHTAFQAMQAIVSEGGLTKEDLAAYQYDPLVSYRRQLPRALQAEDAMALNMYASLDSRITVSTALALANTPNYEPHRLVLFGLGPVYRVFALVPDLQAHRRHMDAVYNLQDSDYETITKRMAELREKIERDGAGPLAKAAAPTMDYFGAAFRADALSAVERTGVAMLRYRAEHGKLPESLAELSPRFIAIVPSDPFDDKPLKMKKTDDGVIIYSIGANLKDDGGTPWDWDAGTGDLTFEVKAEGKGQQADEAKEEGTL